MRLQKTRQALSVTSSKQQFKAAVVILSVGLLAVTRSPYLFARGRVWAEELNVYLFYAANHGPTATLTYVDLRAGYFHLVSNLFAASSEAVGIRYAPLLSVYVSAILLALVVYQIVGSTPIGAASSFNPTLPQMVLAAALLVTGTHAHPEVWLNTLNTQTILAVAAFHSNFVCYRKTKTSVQLLIACNVLIASFTGLYVAALIPMFFARWIYARQRVHTRVFAIAAVGSVFQLLVVARVHALGQIASSKLDSIPSVVDGLRQALALHAAATLVGQPRSQTLYRFSVEENFRASSTIILVVVALCILLATAYRFRQRDLALAGVGFVGLSSFTIVGSLGGLAGGRYSVAPIGAIIVTVVIAFLRSASLRENTAATAIAIVILINGVSDFYVYRPADLSCIECPDWSDQIRESEFRTDAPILAWPYPRWSVDFRTSDPRFGNLRELRLLQSRN